GINVQLAAGIVTGDAATGTDTLRSIESVRGTNFADVYDATGFSTTSVNAGSAGAIGTVAFNSFQGLGGDDLITGNGDTQIVYSNALAAVMVDLSQGKAFSTDTPLDSAGIGTDTIMGGVNSVVGSNFNDTITGSSGNETLTGGAGNDRIEGGAGIDI